MTGTIVGRYLAPHLGVGRAIVAAVLGGGLLFFPLVAATTLPAAVVLIFAGGLLGAFSVPWIQTLRMRIIPPDMRSRAFGAIRTMTNSLAPVAAIAAGFLVPAIGVPAIFMFVGAGWILTGSGLASVRQVRESVA